MERHVYHTPSLYYTKKRPERKGMTYGNDKTLYVTGYRSFELGIFQGKDPKITVIKMSKKELASYIETGVEWILISGNLGVELWTAEVVGELKRNIQKFS